MTIFDPSFLKKKHFWSNFLAAITKIGPISVIFIVIKMIVLSSKLPVLGKFVHFARSLSPQSHKSSKFHSKEDSNIMSWRVQTSLIKN